MKKSRHVFALLALTLLLQGQAAFCQQSRRDSTVTQEADGGTLVRYSIRPFDFGSPVQQASQERLPLSFTEVQKRHFIENLHRESSRKASQQPGRRTPAHTTSTSDLSSYAVGEIPLAEGTTPTGSRTYQIPFANASISRFLPSVGLAYNSQAAEGWAGHGWDIQGVSSISLVSRNRYYHGAWRGARTSDPDAVFALDGMPLVTNTQTYTRSSFPLITASGNILVCPNRNALGYVESFLVKYPDGATAQFGTGAPATSNRLTYPVSEMTDIDGNRMTFEYFSDVVGGSTGRLRSIRYGYGQSGTSKGEISFAYEPSPSYVMRYQAGKPFSRPYRLSSVVSRNGGELLCRYDFSYEQKDNVSLLSLVECSSSGGEQLRPLVFEYGTPDDASRSSEAILRKSNSLLLSSAYDPSADVDFVYKRGKFIRDSFNDGLLVYPAFETYGVKDTRNPLFGSRKYLFGSTYPSDQVFLFAPSLSDYNAVDTGITAGDGFQTLESVDVDGDGLDEIVKVNLAGVAGSRTRLQISIYRCSLQGVAALESQFEVQLEGTITSGDFVSPYRRAYHWGDFLGNGKVQLLALAYDRNYNGYQDFDQTSYATLIDLSGRSTVSEEVLFAFTSSDQGNLLVCDLDCDGQTELCHAVTSGLDVYRHSGTGFTLERTVAGLYSGVMSSAGRPCYFADLNGDGYLDIMRAPASATDQYWGRYAFDGESFQFTSMPIAARASGDSFMFTDVNQDGLSDLVRIGSGAIVTFMNLDGASFGSPRYSTSTISNTCGIVPANIVDHSGTCSFIKLEGFRADEYRYDVQSPAMRQLTRSVDSSGRLFVNSYTYLPSVSMYWSDADATVDNSASYAFRTLPIYVLEGEDAYLGSQTGTGIYRNRHYIYRNGVVHNLGLGFCGFRKISSYDYTGAEAELTEEVHDPEKRGVVTSVTRRLLTSPEEVLSSVTNTYDDNRTTYGKLNPRLVTQTTKDFLTGLETTTSYTYGSYDLPVSIRTARRVGRGTALTEEVSRVYSNSVSPSLYVLGAVTEESVVKKPEGHVLFSWKERRVNTYDSHFHPLSTKHYVGDCGVIHVRPGEGGEDEERIPGGTAGTHSVVIPPVDPGEPGVPRDSTLNPFNPFDPIGDVIVLDATNLVSETRWQYDGWGNVISEKVAHYESTEFVGDTYSYDADGCHLLSRTDALGHTTTYGGYDRFGQPSSATDHRGRVTTTTYDDWGKAVSVSHPDGSVDETETIWGGAGLYTVTSRSTGQPETVTHYDALRREVRAGSLRFDGQWQWTDREYDGKGRVLRESLPYRESAPEHWNTYEYDGYDRPVSLEEASGKTTTWSYSGTSVTTEKDGIWSTVTKDANGNVVSVEDEGGTITYRLRYDGQPSEITAPGGVVTSFAYDEYGRRVSMEDPSAGTQTDDYVWNEDGTSVVTHTNPNGEVITWRDAYGRVTLVERPGEYDTEYEYDADGLLVSEQSGNDTGKEYTYDALDRVSSVTETAPDGRWLRKTYSYGAGGVLSSMQYSTQTGAITTEQYSYSNGWNTGITLPDGTVVWSLESENDLGRPTEITTGSVSREYGFTAFGMPTYRRMDAGDLQSFTYDFDVATGNLLSRSDGVNGQGETFGYDALNRLVEMGNRSISYGDNGNILSMDGVGQMDYEDVEHPYRITDLTVESAGLLPLRQQSVTYTSFDRPAVLTEGGRSATFIYTADGDRARMTVEEAGSLILDRFYIGGRYEYDQTPGGSKERLYLGGDAYSAPMVFQREDGGLWVAYNIGRDYLGSITHIATVDGVQLAEYSYDPWGRLRDPQTLAVYAAGSEPELFLGRGFTGHEHLSWFGLINMNARLYDPLLGRFLSPDPYVQTPDFTQNFNRYSYALNNPLRYTDESGEFVFSMFLGPFGAILDAACWGAVIGGSTYITSVAFSEGGFNNWDGSSFGKSIGWGAITGAVTAGIGNVFGAVGSNGIMGELARAYTHGFANGMISELSGGDFLQGFASGSFGSLTGSAFMMYGGRLASSVLANYVLSAGIGGLGSSLAGGDFWQGAAIGLMNAGLNHMQHQVENYKFFNRLRNHYANSSGEDFVLSQEEFLYLINNGDILSNKAKLGEDGYYSTQINFYDSKSDLKYSFGRATVKYSLIDNQPDYVGFYDRYDFDPQRKSRSLTAEIITRIYGKLFRGTPFNIFYGKSVFLK